MPDTQTNPIADLVSQAREKLDQELRAQSEQLEKLEQSLRELRGRHQQLEETIQQQLGVLAKFEPPAPAPAAPDGELEKLLGSVRNLITATLPEQVFDVLTEEGEQLGVRAAVFDIRGKAAWGSSARGFGSGLSENAFRALVVPLSQENPFRQVYETGGHVDASAALLKKNRNILDKLRPSPEDSVLLLPIRSAGSVSAIFYADAGGKGKPLPVDGLKILAEFAGAQLDRLMALSGGVPTEAVERAPAEEVEEAVVEAEPVTMPGAGEAEIETRQAEPVAEALGEEASVAAGAAQASAAPVLETAPGIEPLEAPLPLPPAPPAAPVQEGAAAGFDLSQLSEADQKVHKDAKRFAKLLVSEIELYNKAKVADGRKNQDLYKRMKADIDRSRQTYEKRFGKTLGKQIDYFHEELVRTLAVNEPSLLGPEYPGPSA